MLDFIKNKTIYANKYRTHSEAIIVSCFFNPQNSPYRIKAFRKFYESIKHLNHSIIECVIGDAEPQLEENENITMVYADSLLWHKEALLNKLISELPAKYKYIFWVDADVVFTNLNWLVDGVSELQHSSIIQPFEYCVHLAKDETSPSFDMASFDGMTLPNNANSNVWRSFCANYVTNSWWLHENYNAHGHVGFAWGAKREVLEQIPLYDRALIGGADHIIAHAAAGQIPNCCITKSFTDDIVEVEKWMKQFYRVVNGNIGYVKGNLYHIWHGDIDNRQYFQRIKEFTPINKTITRKDKNGLYINTHHDETYMRNYFRQREVPADDGFLTSMALGYMTDSTLIGTLGGGNMMGAMLGDMLNNHDHSTNSSDNAGFGSFGGGDFGGGGAGSNWDAAQPVSLPIQENINDTPANDNFS